MAAIPDSQFPIEARLSPPNALPKVKREQHRKLEDRFRESRNPTSCDLMLIAAEVGLSEIETKTWFQHRLAIWRRQQGLPANEGSIID